MLALLYGLGIVAGILLEATLTTLPLGLIFIVLGAASGLNLKLSFALAVFALGIVTDILLLRPLGLTATVYIFTLVLMRLYSRKMETARLRYLLPFSAIVVGLYSQYFYAEWREQTALAALVIIIVRLLTGTGPQGYDRLKLNGI